MIKAGGPIPRGTAIGRVNSKAQPKAAGEPEPMPAAMRRGAIPSCAGLQLGCERRSRPETC
jgi:hypothetical protein